MRNVRLACSSHNRYLDLVTLGGELKLRNYEDREVEIRISTSVPGKAIEASDGGGLRVDASKLELLKRESELRWRVLLKPGESKVLRYRYERYVPSS